MRMPFIAVVVALAAMLTATVAPTVQAEDKPIKIGFLAPVTGPFADAGKDMVEGAQLALKKLGGKIAGRPVELLIEDTAADPDTGLSRARLLVEQSQVDLLMGVYHGGVAMAVTYYAKQHKFPLVITGGAGATAPIYEVKPQPYVFRVTHSIAVMNNALGFYTASVLGKRRAVTIAFDYIAGRDGAEGFKQGFEAGGGQIIKQIFVKLGTPDYSPYFPSIPADADVVHMYVTSTDAVRFVKQFADLGYKSKFPLVADAIGMTDHLLPEMGVAAEGIITDPTYMTTASTPGNKEFVDAYRKAIGGDPGPEAAYCYSGMFYIAKAIDSIQGNITDRAKLLDALAKTSMPDTVRGPFSLNKMNDIIFTVNMTRVVKSGSGLKHEVLTTYDKLDALVPFHP